MDESSLNQPMNKFVMVNCVCIPHNILDFLTEPILSFKPNMTSAIVSIDSSGELQKFGALFNIVGLLCFTIVAGHVNL